MSARRWVFGDESDFRDLQRMIAPRTMVHDLQRDTCPCGGSYEEELVEVTMTVDDERRVMTNVNQRACPSCGARVYSPATLERIESLIRNESSAAS